MAEKIEKKSSLAVLYQIISALYLVGFFQVAYVALKAAYEIRLYAIQEYGRVIHEFDPYFNYRAAEYLWQHGWRKFFTWFDYQSWYPLGRPVGTTIYPGMQFTSMWIKMFVLPNWSINDICVFLPAWFGVLATFCTAALCYVCVQSTASSKTTSILQDIPIISTIYKAVLVPIVKALAKLIKTMTGATFGIPNAVYSSKAQLNPPALESAIFCAAIMAIVPAHLLRSVGGGYDNESVATTAMQLTFWMWCWTVWAKEAYAIPLGIISGICYFYMVTCWGGYIFVINLIGMHAGILLLLRKISWTHLYKAYTSFYLVGTILAIQLPVVNWTPLKSLEQLGPCAVFLGFQVLQLMHVLELRNPRQNVWKTRIQVLLGCLVAAAPIAWYLYSTGYFGPFSSRVRGLFVKHTKTGNPLVDSVAEHQAASPEAYFQYLHDVVTIAPIGLAIVTLLGCTASSSFLILYGVTAYFFSHKMVRLILLTAPIASICGGIALGYGWAWMMGAIFGAEDRPSLEHLFMADEQEPVVVVEAQVEADSSSKSKAKAAAGKGKKKAASKPAEDEDAEASVAGNPLWARAIRLGVSAYIIYLIIPSAKEFHRRAHEMAKGISHPTIISKGRTSAGEDVVVDDYREAYWWLRDNTPEDARIMAWWDYGYQITGIANRTTIADGNTWNHEHIALLGRILTSPEKDGHRIARHLADYILLWTGGGGDDVAKSPHLIRIANSVYRGMCEEPTCRTFGMMSNGQPSPQLAESLLYKLHSHGLKPGVEADRNRFKEVFISKYRKVRIFKILKVSEESKEWVENNRICDTEGSWFCRGQYPPALQKILKEKRDFKQLEDFNSKSEKDDEYTRQYFENLNNPNKQQEPRKQEPRKQEPRKLEGGDSALGKDQYEIGKLKSKDIEMLNENWEDNEMTTVMWQVISNADVQAFADLLKEQPEIAHIRSEDGRGPMWWAYEYKRPWMIDTLKQLGVSDERKDKNGIRAVDLK